jgi:hypothetical protein
MLRTTGHLVVFVGALAVAWLAGKGSKSPDLLRPNFRESEKAQKAKFAEFYSEHFGE